MIVCTSILIPRDIFLSLSMRGHHEGLETGCLDLVSRVNSWHCRHCLLSYAPLGQDTVFQPVPRHFKPWGVVAARRLTTILASILGHLAPGLAWMATAVRMTVTCAFIWAEMDKQHMLSLVAGRPVPAVSRQKGSGILAF